MSAEPNRTWHAVPLHVFVSLPFTFQLFLLLCFVAFLISLFLFIYIPGTKYCFIPAGILGSEVPFIFSFISLLYTRHVHCELAICNNLWICVLVCVCCVSCYRSCFPAWTCFLSFFLLWIIYTYMYISCWSFLDGFVFSIEYFPCG